MQSATVYVPNLWVNLCVDPARGRGGDGTKVPTSRESGARVVIISVMTDSRTGRNPSGPHINRLYMAVRCNCKLQVQPRRRTEPCNLYV